MRHDSALDFLINMQTHCTETKLLAASSVACLLLSGR